MERFRGTPLDVLKGEPPSSVILSGFFAGIRAAGIRAGAAGGAQPMPPPRDRGGVQGCRVTLHPAHGLCVMPSTASITFADPAVRSGRSHGESRARLPYRGRAVPAWHLPESLC